MKNVIHPFELPDLKDFIDVIPIITFLNVCWDRRNVQLKALHFIRAGRARLFARNQWLLFYFFISVCTALESNPNLPNTYMLCVDATLWVPKLLIDDVSSNKSFVLSTAFESSNAVLATADEDGVCGHWIGDMVVRGCSSFIIFSIAFTSVLLLLFQFGFWYHEWVLELYLDAKGNWSVNWPHFQYPTFLFGAFV